MMRGEGHAYMTPCDDDGCDELYEVRLISLIH
jgi:hypothetical protein